MNEALLKYGLGGIIIAGMAWFILYLMKDHKKEREEMRVGNEKQRIEDRETRNKQFKRMEEMADESNKSVRENTNILTGLKTLLENKNR